MQTGKRLKQSCCYTAALSLVQLSVFRQVADFAPVSWIDRCMNASQPLKVIFVVFFLQVVSALESNPTARRTQLHHKFEQVIALVEDNIYECCSEA